MRIISLGMGDFCGVAESRSIPQVKLRKEKGYAELFR